MISRSLQLATCVVEKSAQRVSVPFSILRWAGIGGIKELRFYQKFRFGVFPFSSVLYGALFGKLFCFRELYPGTTRSRVICSLYIGDCYKYLIRGPSAITDRNIVAAVSSIPRLRFARTIESKEDGHVRNLDKL